MTVTTIVLAALVLVLGIALGLAIYVIRVIATGIVKPRS